MRVRKAIWHTLWAVGFVAALVLCVAGCSDVEDKLDVAREKIKRELARQKLVDRDFIPEEGTPAITNPNGFYDVVGGAYRFVENEGRENRDRTPRIERGARVSFDFDARIYDGNSFDSSPTYYTNIEARMPTGNGVLTGEGRSTEPKTITLGAGDILKAIEESLVSCRAEGATTSPDGSGAAVTIPGDVVRIYLTPNLAYGDHRNGSVPPSSTVVWRLQNIKIIE